MAGHARLILGCGYLGCRVAQRCLAAGDRVLAVTRSTQHAAELAASGIHPILGDVLKPETLRDLPAGATVIYAVGYDRAGAGSKREVYVDGLRNVLSAVPSETEQFVYVSSTSVYGQNLGEWIDECSETVPQSDGGRICLDAELLLRESWTSRGVLTILRSSGLYGPGRLIARIESLQARQPLPGPAEAWLNLIHVDDAAAAVMACLNRRSSTSRTLLLTDDEPVQRRKYYELLSSMTGAPPPQFELTASRDVDLGKRCRNRVILDALGLQLQFPTIREGLPHAVSFSE